MTTTMGPNLAALRARAWKAAAAAQAALETYANAAEDFEQPRMGNDAVDAGDLAAKMAEYNYRFDDAADDAVPSPSGQRRGADAKSTARARPARSTRPTCARRGQPRRSSEPPNPAASRPERRTAMTDTLTPRETEATLDLLMPRAEAVAILARIKTRPTIKLVGTNGNAFAVLGKCRAAAFRAGWTDRQRKAFTRLATAGDYDHLLGTAMQYFDVT